MPLICREHDLLFTPVPETADTFVQRVLERDLGGERTCGPEHASFRSLQIENPPSIRFFTVREPVDWYRSYWAHARASMKHPKAWPIWAGGDVRHPTLPLDERCGHRDFAHFVRNALRVFPEGFLRSVYCDFLNGSTHVLRYEHLREHLEALLEMVGHENPAVVHEMPNETIHDGWRRQAVLPRQLERELRDIENLDGLSIPYVGST
jgi:hypothetical protein